MSSNYGQSYTETWQLVAPQAEAWKLYQAGVFKNGTWSSDPDRPFWITLEFKLRRRAIFAARPGEMVRGGGFVMFLPREWDHRPDGYEPAEMWFTVNGSAIEYSRLEELLAVAGPGKQVAAVRAALAKINQLEAEGKGFVL